MRRMYHVSWNGLNKEEQTDVKTNDRYADIA